MNYRQLRNRVLRLRRRNRVASADPTFEVFSTGKDIYQRVPSARQAALLADELAQRNPGIDLHVWTPDQQHVYEVVGDSNKMPIKNTAGFDTDESLVSELVMWINNAQIPYNQLQAVEKNMARKLSSGEYDSELAVKGFMYAVESGAKDYAREFGGKWYKMFPKEIRLQAADDLRAEFETKVDLRPQDYEEHVYKKHQPQWRERYPKEGSTMRKKAGFDTDESLAVELRDWIVNDYDTYKGLVHMQENMANMMAKGVYDPELAVKQFFWAANAGAKSYAETFGGTYHQMFPKSIRMLAARMLRDEFEAEVEINPQDFAGRMPKKHLPERERYPKEGSATKRQAALFNPPAEGAVPHDLVSSVAMELDYDVYGALDLGLELLEDGNYHQEMADIIEIAEKLDSGYQYQGGSDRALMSKVNDTTGWVGTMIAQFMVDLLEDVNWHSLGEELDDYFFGHREERYPETYPEGSDTRRYMQERREQRNEKLNRGASAANRPQRGQYKGSELMTRKPSRSRRRRFASRVDDARRRDSDKRQEADYDDKAARLERRVASLSRLLQKAEQELVAEQRPPRRRPQRPSDRRKARVADIRERIATERRRKERVARIQRRVRAKRRIAELQREADTARQPPSRKPAPRRASRKLAPAAKGKRYIATYRKGDKAAGKPPYKILDQKTGKTHVLVDDK